MATTLSTGTISAARDAAVAAIEAAADDLTALSKFIHQHPEVALEEVRASAACAEFLEARGFAVERGLAGLPTAFAAGAGDGAPRVAYLAEYDALPGLGHGCGHNLIAMSGVAAGLGLGAALRAGGLPGSVRVFGTPAEEAVGGKVIMAAAGVFNGIDAAMGAHPGSNDTYCPTVAGSGLSLACEEVRIAYHGRAAHAAADPYNGINALNAIVEVFNGINALRQHVKSDARLHGIITDGGQAANVVPDFARAEFFVRAAKLEDMNQLVERVRQIAEGAALMTGARLEFEVSGLANSDMVTNLTLARQLKRNLDAVGLEMPEATPEPPSGSTDWGNVSYEVPSVETGFPILDRICTWHSPEVVVAADSKLGYRNTLLVAKAMALTGIDILTDPALLTKIQAEFAHVPPLPAIAARH
ncbi:MAG: M20 family metallopeptidase [Chloroflexia bacterium]|nr:M20 family metallopeptidase [Chloroflexia bacterium]